MKGHRKRRKVLEKSKEKRKGDGKRRKREKERGGEIVSYYETDFMWLRVLQGLFVFIDGTAAFPCHRH